MTDNKDEEGGFAISPIIAHGDIIGSVIIFEKKGTLEESDFQIAKIVSSFLAKHIEQ